MRVSLRALLVMVMVILAALGLWWRGIILISFTQKYYDQKPPVANLAVDTTGGVVGRHVIAELTGCAHCDYDENMSQVIEKAVQAAGATLLHVYVHKFEPQGMTGVAVLAESHITFHTWPETGYVAVDIFTCGAHTHPEAALKVLQDYFKATNARVWHFQRGMQ